MTRLGMAPTSRLPDLRRYVAVCMTCNHWQIDVRPGAISDLGGWLESMKAIGEEHVAHLEDCPGAGGRVNFAGQWVDPPRMKSGKEATGTMALHPLPRWWVAA